MVTPAVRYSKFFLVMDMGFLPVDPVKDQAGLNLRLPLLLNSESAKK